MPKTQQRSRVPASVLGSEVCYGVVKLNHGTDEAQAAGVEFVESVPAPNQPSPVCIFWFDDRIAEQVLKVCPYEGMCMADVDAPGYDGVKEIRWIQRVDRPIIYR
jgi:hypothetical protein